MKGPAAALLSGGRRLHLQHGPIDLIIGADGDRPRAFSAAQDRFNTVLSELMEEYALLRRPVQKTGNSLEGEIAQRMQSAASDVDAGTYVTPMAAVAGAVAETVLEAMCASAELSRAYVNNGGDIALHLDEGASFKMAMAAHNGRALGQVEIVHSDPVRGIATSGRHGRSFSLGIADSVTVLAARASQSDVAATMIANAVDLPGHAAIQRTPAHELDDTSDLGALPVVTGCAPLSRSDALMALRSGQARAADYKDRGLIAGACLFLQDEAMTVGHAPLTTQTGKTLIDA